nr:hypothetical protein [Tanacetum cinerariifolium]
MCHGYVVISLVDKGAKRYGAFAIGVAPGIRSIPNSTRLSGGIPGRSSGNTSGKSHTTVHSYNKVKFTQLYRIEEQRCYQFGEPGHIRPTCPDLAPRETRPSKNKRKDLQKPRTRAFNMTMEEARVMPDIVLVEATKMDEKDRERTHDFHYQKRRFISPNNNNKKGRFMSVPNKGFNSYKPCNTCGKARSGLCRMGNSMCFKCGMVGHMAQSCRIEEQRCYQFGEPGHIRPTCPDLAPRETRPSKNKRKDLQKPRTRAFNMTMEEAR